VAGSGVATSRRRSSARTPPRSNGRIASTFLIAVTALTRWNAQVAEVVDGAVEPRVVDRRGAGAGQISGGGRVETVFGHAEFGTLRENARDGGNPAVWPSRRTDASGAEADYGNS
jgi:hypothetical protein